MLHRKSLLNLERAKLCPQSCKQFFNIVRFEIFEEKGKLRDIYFFRMPVFIVLHQIERQGVGREQDDKDK
jgi:hypothetical protein